MEQAVEVSKAMVEVSKAMSESTDRILEIDPDDVQLDPMIMQLRDQVGLNDENLEIPELMRTIVEEGQVEAVKCRRKQGQIFLMDGLRRLRAVSRARQQGFDGNHLDEVDELGYHKEEIKLKVIIYEDVSDMQALRIAALSFTQKLQLHPIEYAHMIQYVRRLRNWHGHENTYQVANFLGVSAAKITSAEKILQTAPEVQEKLRSGLMNAAAAQDIRSTPPELQPAVVEASQQLANAEAAKKGNGRKRRSGTAFHKTAPTTETTTEARDEAHDEAPAEAPREGEASAAPPPPPKDAPIGQKHVRKAQRQVEGDKAKLRAPKLAEVIELMEHFGDDEHSPKPMRRFANRFSEWAHGQTDQREVEDAWEDLTLLVVPVSLPNKRKTAKKTMKGAKKTMKGA